jgi:hypothetical protein
MYIESDYFADEYDIDTGAALSALHAVLEEKVAAGFTPLILTDANRSLHTRPTDQLRRRDHNTAFADWLHDADLQSAQQIVADEAGELQPTTPTRMRLVNKRGRSMLQGDDDAGGFERVLEQATIDYLLSAPVFLRLRATHLAVIHHYSPHPDHGILELGVTRGQVEVVLPVAEARGRPRTVVRYPDAKSPEVAARVVEAAEAVAVQQLQTLHPGSTLAEIYGAFELVYDAAEGVLGTRTVGGAAPAVGTAWMHRTPSGQARARDEIKQAQACAAAASTSAVAERLRAAVQKLKFKMAGYRRQSRLHDLRLWCTRRGHTVDGKPVSHAAQVWQRVSQLTGHDTQPTITALFDQRSGKVVTGSKRCANVLARHFQRLADKAAETGGSATAEAVEALASKIEQQGWGILWAEGAGVPLRDGPDGLGMLNGPMLDPEVQRSLLKAPWDKAMAPDNKSNNCLACRCSVSCLRPNRLHPVEQDVRRRGGGG